jgi:hypothetical protein
MCTPSERAVACVSCNMCLNPSSLSVLGRHKMATRLRVGTICLSRLSLCGVSSGIISVMLVMIPPGWSRLLTIPVATGSTLGVMMMATRPLACPVLLGRLSSSARLSPRWWRQHRPATGGGPTPTSIPSLPLGCRPPPTLQLVIIGQFFARRDRAQGFQIHPPLLDHRFAVRCARVIAIARLIAPPPPHQ